MTQSIGRNQIRPAAQPVSSFIQASRPSPAAPPNLATWSRNPPQIQAIAQRTRAGDVPGYNQFQQLAASLAPFSQSLLGLGATAMNTYASAQYQRGQAEARKAMVLANQQMLRSGAEYARENRRLQGKDPAAAEMMDRVNPFREAGRINAISRIAAEQAATTLNSAYRNRPDAVLWKEGSPQLAKLQAEATAQLLDRFGLSQETQGYVDYVEPEINKAWDGIVAQHKKDRVDYLKNTVAGTTYNEIISFLMKLESSPDGRFEFETIGPDGNLIRQSVSRSDDPAFYDKAVVTTMSQKFGFIRGQLGLRGETIKAETDVIKMLVTEALNTQDERLMRYARMLESSVMGPDGTGVPAGIAYQEQFLDQMFERDSQFFELDNRANTRQLYEYERNYQRIVEEYPDRGPEMQQAIAELDAMFPDLRVNDREGAKIRAIKRNNEMAELTVSGTVLEQANKFLSDIESSPIGMVMQNKEQLAEVFEGFMQQLPGEAMSDMRTELREKFNDLVGDKASKRGATNVIDWGPQRNKHIAALIATKYPKAGRQMAEIDPDNPEQAMAQMLSQMLANQGSGDPNYTRIKQGKAILDTHYNTIFNNLYEQAILQSPDGVLTRAQKQALINEALSKPPPDLPSAPTPESPGAAGSPQAGASGPRQGPPAPKTFPLDNSVDDLSEQTLRTGLPTRQSVMSELRHLANGGKPTRALRQLRDRLGAKSSGELLLRYADRWNLPIEPTLRERIRRVASAESGATDLLAGVMSLGDRIQTAGGRALLAASNLMLGIPPASAATMNGGGQRSTIPFSPKTSLASRSTPVRTVRRTAPRPQRQVFAYGGGAAVRGGSKWVRDPDKQDSGYDVSLPGGSGSPIASPVPSLKITEIGFDGHGRGDSGRGFGRYVAGEFTASDGKRYELFLGHLDGVNVKVGDVISKGTVIGKQGTTGRAIGAHVTTHINAKQGGNPWGVLENEVIQPWIKGWGGGTAAASASSGVDFSTLLSRHRKFLQQYRLRKARALTQRASNILRPTRREYGSTWGLRRSARSRVTAAGVPDAAYRYLRSITELESDNRNNVSGYAEAQGGGFAAGRFQFTPITLKDAEQLGIPRSQILSNDERVQYPAVLRFIEARHPDAYQAILRGDYNTADRLLNRRWVSLPGGSEQASPERMRRAMRFRTGR